MMCCLFCLSHAHILDYLLKRMKMESDRLGQLHPEDKSVQLYKWLRITDELRQTVFHACCQHAYRQALWTIVQYCSPDMLREAFLDQDGLTKATPLHLAVTHHHYDMVKLLAISGQVVDVNAKNENGDTPVHLALFFNGEFLSNEYVDLLLNLGMPTPELRMQRV